MFTFSKGQVPICTLFCTYIYTVVERPKCMLAVMIIIIIIVDLPTADECLTSSKLVRSCLMWSVCFCSITVDVMCLFLSGHWYINQHAVTHTGSGHQTETGLAPICHSHSFFPLPANETPGSRAGDIFNRELLLFCSVNGRVHCAVCFFSWAMGWK